MAKSTIIQLPVTTSIACIQYGASTTFFYLSQHLFHISKSEKIKLCNIFSPCNNAFSLNFVTNCEAKAMPSNFQSYFLVINKNLT